MERREFLKRMAIMAGGAALKSIVGPFQGLSAQAGQALTQQGGVFPHLVAVKGGKPTAMLDAALAASGGMGRFVKKGGTVVVKPNIGWDVAPELAANTDPALVARIVEHCLKAGASKVYVFDHTCDAWKAAYKNSQIERYAQDAGASIVPAHAESYYQEAALPGAKSLRKAKFHELLFEADSFINVPVLKNHGGAGMTACLKNLMGVVWDRGYLHANGLDRTIAELALFRKPSLNIVDANRVMRSGGPRGYSGSRYLDPRMLLLSADPVAADAASAKILGFEPSSFGYIGLAAEAGLGSQRLEELDLRRITL